jgi:hypothetical protein
MDENMINELVKAKIAENYLTALIDTILDSTRYSKYANYELVIDDEGAILALVKAIDPEAFYNRLESLKAHNIEENIKED